MKGRPEEAHTNPCLFGETSIQSRARLGGAFVPPESARTSALVTSRSAPAQNIENVRSRLSTKDPSTLPLPSARQRLGLRQSSGAFSAAWAIATCESARGLAHSKTWRHWVYLGCNGHEPTIRTHPFMRVQLRSSGLANNSAMVSWNSGSSFSVSDSCPANMPLSIRPYSLL